MEELIKQIGFESEGDFHKWESSVDAINEIRKVQQFPNVLNRTKVLDFLETNNFLANEGKCLCFMMNIDGGIRCVDLRTFSKTRKMVKAYNYILVNEGNINEFVAFCFKNNIPLRTKRSDINLKNASMAHREFNKILNKANHVN